MSHLGSRVALYAFVTLKLHPNSHCKRYAKKTSFDLQKDLVRAEFTEVEVQCDAAHWRLVEKLRMCKNSLNIGLKKKKTEKVLFSDESHFLFQGNTAYLLGSGIVSI